MDRGAPGWIRCALLPLACLALSGCFSFDSAVFLNRGCTDEDLVREQALEGRWARADEVDERPISDEPPEPALVIERGDAAEVHAPPGGSGEIEGTDVFLSARLTRPLRQIMQAAQQVAERNYDVEISAGSSDELSLLAEEFTAMARKLKAFHNLDIKQIVAEKQKSEAIIRSMTMGSLLLMLNSRSPI